MSHLLNTKILLSGATILAASALIFGATFAFFSDSETSTDNLLEAGEIDLQIDSEAHYAGLVCQAGVWVDDNPTSTTRPDLVGDSCVGTWALKDLGEGDMFFSLEDIKPGDSGENTISMHVFDNDAWARMIIENVQSLDNTCTDPESEVTPGTLDPECSAPSPTPGAGELQKNILFSIWLDEGTTPGFQNASDSGEGDNIQQEGEPTLVASGPLDPGGETLNIWEGLAPVYSAHSCTGDGSAGGNCPGLTSDGHMIGSITYYFGLSWEIPVTVGNEVQTDSLSADIKFEAQQYRNNPIPFAP